MKGCFKGSLKGSILGLPVPKPYRSLKGTLKGSTVVYGVGGGGVGERFWATGVSGWTSRVWGLHVLSGRALKGSGARYSQISWSILYVITWVVVQVRISFGVPNSREE